MNVNEIASRLMKGALSLLLAVPLVLANFGSASEVHASTQATYYASPTGSGSTCSISAPCSLTGVRDKVRTVNTAMTGDIVIELRGGTYNMTSPLTLDYRDSGTAGYKVLWHPYGTEVPVISGGQDLSSGWVLHDATANIYKKTGVTGPFRSFYVNDNRVDRARTPNKTDPDSLGPYYKTISGDPVTQTLKINKSEIASWANFSKVEMVDQPHWYHDNARLNSYTTDTSYAYVTFQSPDSVNVFNKPANYYTGNSYHFENAYELLDAEGEWYLDTGISTLYYKPRSVESMGSVTVFAPQTDTLFDLVGTTSNPVHHIEFNGLVFKYSGWNDPSNNGLVATQGVQPIGNTLTNQVTVSAAVQVQYGNNLRFIGNTWKHTGANGLKFTIGVKNSQIVGNQFSDIAANAIVLDSGSPAPDKTSDILVANNTISRVGQLYTNGMGIIGLAIKNTIIEHNTISYGPYMGMQIGQQVGCHCDGGMSGNEIRYNNIHHMMQLHDDGGGIYTLGRQPGTRVFENYIHDIARSTYAMSFPVAAVYLDNFSEFITVEHNVISNIGTGAQNTYEQTGVGAQNNTLTNNGTQDTSVINAAGVQAGYIEPTYLLSEGFNGYTTGATLSDWTTDSSGGTATAELTDKSLKIRKTNSATSTTVENDFMPTSGKVSVSARVWANETTGWKMAPYILDSTGTIAISVIFDSGYIKTYNGSTLISLEPFTANKWYSIGVDLDTNTDTFDLSVNGLKLIDDAAFRNPVTNVAAAYVGIGVNNTGTFYVDDFKAIYTGANPPTLLAFDDFNNTAVGTAPTGWTITTTDGTATAEEVAGQSDKGLKINKSGTANTASATKSFTPASGVVTMVAEVMAEQTTGWKSAPYIMDSTGTTAVSVILDSGYIKTYDGATLLSLQSFTPNTWYTIKVVMNTNTDTFDLYVNGALLKSGAAFRNAVTNIGKVYAGIGVNHTGSFYVNQIIVSTP
ncbi:right-handed parallel beta-helix repeat-containing protein [Paenibacillus roseipurpureus]|uniref:Right-handed parallel beta-helix repeat-containing protein n=1 Tax=Paenibacillus roseopurpureus TaxID=2918901 RepID=A0AA96LKV5_9BACL|nr:right-handed parallel beta-helix repeat-containing protein [Paenibacillus sp. MBLB1832]WNR42824.1 right-handed parallel beta-helix repeat-containing protein [Paenibacillus sp. MBLB1832]